MERALFNMYKDIYDRISNIESSLDSLDKKINVIGERLEGFSKIAENDYKEFVEHKKNSEKLEKDELQNSCCCDEECECEDEVDDEEIRLIITKDGVPCIYLG